MLNYLPTDLLKKSISEFAETSNADSSWWINISVYSDFQARNFLWVYGVTLAADWPMSRQPHSPIDIQRLMNDQ